MEQITNRLSAKLLETIEERIVTGEYPAGASLDEVRLAEAFGVSRTPIREALIQLSVMNMIEKRPRKGWVVTEISPARLCEMFELMAELEAICARLAARRATLFQATADQSSPRSLQKHKGRRHLFPAQRNLSSSDLRSEPERVPHRGGAGGRAQGAPLPASAIARS